MSSWFMGGPIGRPVQTLYWRTTLDDVAFGDHSSIRPEHACHRGRRRLGVICGRASLVLARQRDRWAQRSSSCRIDMRDAACGWINNEQCVIIGGKIEIRQQAGRDEFTHPIARRYIPKLDACGSPPAGAAPPASQRPSAVQRSRATGPGCDSCLSRCPDDKSISQMPETAPTASALASGLKVRLWMRSGINVHGMTRRPLVRPTQSRLLTHACRVCVPVCGSRQPASHPGCNRSDC